MPPAPLRDYRKENPLFALKAQQVVAFTRVNSVRIVSLNCMQPWNRARSLRILSHLPQIISLLMKNLFSLVVSWKAGPCASMLIEMPTCNCLETNTHLVGIDESLLLYSFPEKHPMLKKFQPQVDKINKALEENNKKKEAKKKKKEEAKKKKAEKKGKDKKDKDKKDKDKKGDKKEDKKEEKKEGDEASTAGGDEVSEVSSQVRELRVINSALPLCCFS